MIDYHLSWCFCPLMGGRYRITGENIAMGGHHRQRISCPIPIKVITTSLHRKINEIGCPSDIHDVFRMTYLCRLGRAIEGRQLTSWFTQVFNRLLKCGHCGMGGSSGNQQQQAAAVVAQAQQHSCGSSRSSSCSSRMGRQVLTTSWHCHEI